jgi:hypothetical protein
MIAERRPRVSWSDALVGAGAFLASHAVVRWGWREWFDPLGAHVPWFLNSGRAVAFSSVWLFIVGAALAASRRDGARLEGAASASGGAILAMIAILVLVGPGSLFPLVLTIGGGIVAASVFAGWLVARRFLTGRESA